MVSHTLQKWGCTQPYNSVARNPKKVVCTLLKWCCNRTSGFSRNNRISRITISARITTSYSHKDWQIHQMYRNQLKSSDSLKFQDSPISHNSPESQSKTINKFTIHNHICQNSRFTKIPGFTRNTTLAKITRFTKAPDLPESLESPK